MDALQKAKQLANEVEKEVNAYFPTLGGKVTAANAYASIAQAEAMLQFVKLFEQWMSIQGILPEFFEAVDRAREAGYLPDIISPLPDDEAQTLADYGDEIANLL